MDAEISWSTLRCDLCIILDDYVDVYKEFYKGKTVIDTMNVRTVLNITLHNRKQWHKR